MNAAPEKVPADHDVLGRPANSQRPLVDCRAAADYLGVSASFLAKRRVNGSGPPYRKFGRRVLYAISDIDAWADLNRRLSTSEEVGNR